MGLNHHSVSNLTHIFRLIFFTCTITPYSLAFPDTYSTNLYIFDIAMNMFFAIDLLINFLSAYYDSNMRLIEDLKVTSLFSNNVVDHCKSLSRWMVRDRHYLRFAL